MKKRLLFFIVFELIIVTFWFRYLKELFYFSIAHNDYGELYSYIMFIPFITIYLLYIKRDVIFNKLSYNLFLGLSVGIIGLIEYLAAQYFSDKINQNDFLFFIATSWILMNFGGFISIFGIESFKKALLPLTILFFMAPIPTRILNYYILFLQKGSEEVTNIFFKILGVPVYRHDNIFQLPNFTIAVAKECSGIRSSIGLWITAFISCFLFLKKTFNRLLLLAMVLPITIIKNGMRIVALALLASYLDPIYITNHWLHKSGGILYFILALFFMFFPLLWFLRNLESE